MGTRTIYSTTTYTRNSTVRGIIYLVIVQSLYLRTDSLPFLIYNNNSIFNNTVPVVSHEILWEKNKETISNNDEN